MQTETTLGKSETMNTETTRDNLANPTRPETFHVLSIDAWRGIEGGWDWNSWDIVGAAPVETMHYTPRRLLAWMRSEGYLAARSKGRVAVQDDGYNLTIIDRRNGCPLYAIEYGRGV